MGKPQAGRREHLERNPSIKSQQRIKVLCPSLCNLDQQDSLKMPEKQLELSKRSAFFSDPFFADLKDSMGAGLERRLAEFSARSMGVAGAGLGEAAHNIQVSASNDKFQIQLELPGFAPEDFSLKTKDDIIIVEAVHESKNEDGSSNSRKFTKEFKMPGGGVTEQLASTYSGAGILTVSNVGVFPIFPFCVSTASKRFLYVIPCVRCSGFVRFAKVFHRIFQRLLHLVLGLSPM